MNANPKFIAATAHVDDNLQLFGPEAIEPLPVSERAGS